MSLLGQAVARELQHSFPSSSSRKYFVLLIRQRQLRQHPLSVLQQHSSLYSTATSSRARSTSFSKNQKDARYAAEKSKPVQQTQMVQKQTQEPQILIEMEQELKKKEQVPKADFPRPSEIPLQTKVANSVNLIGYVQIPVQFEASADGKSWAGTIISQSDGDSLDTPPFWIPVIFEGDLAHIAACHLKAKDRVHIAGQLSADPPPFTMGEGQANVQVMVRSISFVEGSSQMKKVVTPNNFQQDNSFAVSEIKDNGHPSFHSWKDLVSNPLEWQDHREDKLKGTLKPKHPDFKRKDSGLALWLDSAPKWVWLHLNGLEFDVRLPKVKQEKSYEGGDDSWKNLVENPDTWWDNRKNKLQEKSPDFKHKVTGEALWLSCSPAWVWSRLPPLKAKDTYTKRGKIVSEAM